MENIVNSVEDAIKNRNWYGALFVALTLPDICGKIDNPEDWPKNRFIEWYQKYVQHNYTLTKIEGPDYPDVNDSDQVAAIHDEWKQKAFPTSKKSKQNELLATKALLNNNIENYIAYSDEAFRLKRENSPLAYDYIFLSGDDCYALRCAVLHEGSDDITAQKAKDVLDRFHFITPKYYEDGSVGELVHCNRRGNILQLQIDIFCKDIIAGVNDWSNAIQRMIPAIKK